METMEELQRFLRPLERYIKLQQEPEAEKRWEFVKRSLALWAKIFRDHDETREEATIRAWRLWYFALIGAGREFIPWMLSSYVGPALPPLPQVDEAYEKALDPLPPARKKANLKLIRGGLG